MVCSPLPLLVREEGRRAEMVVPAEKRARGLRAWDEIVLVRRKRGAVNGVGGVRVRMVLVRKFEEMGGRAVRRRDIFWGVFGGGGD